MPTGAGFVPIIITGGAGGFSVSAEFSAALKNFPDRYYRKADELASDLAQFGLELVATLYHGPGHCVAVSSPDHQTKILYDDLVVKATMADEQGAAVQRVKNSSGHLFNPTMLIFYASPASLTKLVEAKTPNDYCAETERLAATFPHGGETAEANAAQQRAPDIPDLDSGSKIVQHIKKLDNFRQTYELFEAGLTTKMIATKGTTKKPNSAVLESTVKYFPGVVGCRPRREAGAGGGGLSFHGRGGWRSGRGGGGWCWGE